ncbi:unnamed protein product, partial [Tetraodon nigroviridis]
DVFDCSHSVPLGSRHYFKYLQSRGVTHFKVPLSWDQILPTGLPSQPQQSVVTCYRNLLKELLGAGLQPLVILHGSSIPDGLRSRFGGWESQELVNKFQQYAEFAFHEFGALVRSWVTLSELDNLQHAGLHADAPSPLQSVLKLHRNIYQIFHEKFPNGGRLLSLGLRQSDVAILPQLKASTTVSSAIVPQEYSPVFIFHDILNNCSPSESDWLQLLGRFLQVVNMNDLHIVGLDVTDMLAQMNIQDVSFSDGVSLKTETEGFKRSYQNVWDRFGPQTTPERDAFLNDSFPAGFQWATSSESFKIEGGWSEGGKGETIWDRFGHENNVFDNQTADLACDSYHKVDYDVYLLRGLHVNTYQFSISWARIFPSGHGGSHSEKGALYYDKLINALIESGIHPVATLYHWDLPQALQDYGGWTNGSIVEAFRDYAEFCFSRFGDRVKTWNTFNSPWVVSHAGYGTGEHPPGIKDYVVASYQVTHNMLKSHAEAWHVYNDKYRKSHGGKVGIALNSDWAEPKDPSSVEDKAAADRYLQSMLGWFAHPVFVNGDYPAALKTQIEKKRNECPLSEPARLPVFTPEESQRIRGTADFFGLTHYTSRLVNSSNGNGMPTEYSGDTFNDSHRIEYMKGYINEALKAYDLDGVNVKGYIATSLMDSFEWRDGYKFAFGLHHVDFNQPNRPRSPKYSAHFYHNVMRDNGFPTPDDEKPVYGHFRKGFIWSTATASYQVTAKSLSCSTFVTSPVKIKLMLTISRLKGVGELMEKGLSIWDKFAHTPLRVLNDDTGDVACNSYNKVEEDVAILKQLKVTHYRFSISWPRVLPDGTTKHINEAGLNYYHRLVDALLAANIQPHITLYHWDLPQALQDIGGWENVTIVDRFKEYADFIFERLGDKVKFWITINEPYNIANIGHGYGAAAPGISFRPGTLPYIVGHHLLKAHAEAWHLYNDKYRAKQMGNISITINSDWSEPRNPYKQEDVDAARRVVQFYIGWFAHPVFNGDYSDTMKTIIRERSLAANLTKSRYRLYNWWKVSDKTSLLTLALNPSRLPEFTPEEIKRIKGTYDYFGFNHYTTVLGFPVDYKNLQHYDADRGAGTIVDRTWLDSGSDWLKVSPFGFRRILNFIKEEYGNPPIIITENGMSEHGPIDLNDVHRSYYYEKYINQVLKAYLLDNVDIRGYTAWSLMDNLEWARGFSERFGLFYVNHSDPNLPRVAKDSVSTYATIITCNGFPDPALGPHECL